MSGGLTVSLLDSKYGHLGLNLRWVMSVKISQSQFFTKAFLLELNLGLENLKLKKGLSPTGKKQCLCHYLTKS